MKFNRRIIFILLSTVVLALLGSLFAGCAWFRPGTMPRACQQWYDKGKQEGYINGFKEGYDRGRTDGKEVGYSEGFTKGIEEGKKLCPSCPECPKCPECPYPYYYPYYYPYPYYYDRLGYWEGYETCKRRFCAQCPTCPLCD